MSEKPANNLRTLVSVGENGFYRVEIEGVGTAQEISRVISEIAVFPDSKKELWIATNARLNMSSAELIALADLAKKMEHRPDKVAIVASDDLTFGLGRIYAGHRETPENQMNVFRTVESALEWLDLDADSEEIQELEEQGWQYHQFPATGCR